MSGRRALKHISDVLKDKKRNVGFDVLELEMLPDSLSKELLAMMGLEYEGRRGEKLPLILLALRP
jgi:hypothetical protein